MALYCSMLSTVFSSYHYIFGYHYFRSSFFSHFAWKYLSNDFYNKIYFRFSTLRLCYSFLLFPLFLSFKKQVSWNFLRLVDSFYEITMLLLRIRLGVYISYSRSYCSLSLSTFSLPQSLRTTVLSRGYFFKTYSKYTPLHPQFSLVHLGSSVS